MVLSSYLDVGRLAPTVFTVEFFKISDIIIKLIFQEVRPCAVKKL